MSADDEAIRQATFFREVMDPYMRALLDADDPWDAYESVASMRGAMMDFLDWGPHGGQVFIAWADLEDQYETGKTPIRVAHAALRQAATDWLERPVDSLVGAYVEEWIARANRSVAEIVDRYGDFWRSPSVGDGDN